jgi:hypothetical protein
MDLGVANHGFEDVGRALGIADEHEPRRTGFLRHRHDRVTDLPRVGLNSGQRIDLDDELVVVVLRRCAAAVPGGSSHSAKQSYPMPATTAATRCRRDGSNDTARPVTAGSLLTGLRASAHGR